MRKQPLKIEISDDRSLAISNAHSKPDQAPRFNIAPTQNNLVFKPSKAEDSVDAYSMRWGIVPSWSKTAQTRSPLINARSETVAEKPAFKAAFQRRRCLVPADGFYEWKKSRSVSVPYFFSMKEDNVFYMAGIWETWHDELGEHFDSYTILTTQANSLLSKYHGRMPVILEGEAIDSWLSHGSSQLGINERLQLFAPFDGKRMKCTPANPAVNNNTSEGPSCLEAPEKQAVSQLDMGF